MKTLYLHIGTPKTGTTAIQTFCWDNREVLAKNGYCYPMFDFPFRTIQPYRNGHFLVSRLYDRNKERRYGEEEQIVNEGMQQVLSLFQKYDKVILSDEGIWNRGHLADTNCWQRLKEHIMSQDIAVKVIVYLRRQDDFLFSWWNQQVKEGIRHASVMDWKTVVEKLPYIQLDYCNILKQIAEYIGKENITVRVYDRKAFLGGSIYSDFLDAVQLNYTEEYQVMPKLQNPSLTKTDIEMKRILNTLPGLDKRGYEFFRKVLTDMSSEAMPETSKKGMFSEEESEQFLSSYKEGNAWIAEEYMDGKELFDYDYHAEEKWNWEEEDKITDVIHLLGAVTVHLLEENDLLKKELEQHINNIRFKMQHPVKAIIKKAKKE